MSYQIPHNYHGDADRMFRRAASRSDGEDITLADLINEFPHLPNPITLRDSQGQQLIHVTAGFGRFRLTKELILLGADVNSLDEDGQAPLHHACNHAHRRVAKLLIKAGADVNLQDAEGITPLLLAVSRHPKASKVEPSYWAVVELLLCFKANPFIMSNKERSCYSRTKDPDQKRELRLAHMNNLLETCHDVTEQQQIIDKYLEIEDFFELVKVGDEKFELVTIWTTRKLLNSRLHSCDNITPLHRAAGYNHLNTAKMFIERGADVNATDELGRIPLHNAAQYGHNDMIELLVGEKSDINRQDAEGKSPLHVAASNKTFTACLKLIELGANIQLRTNDNELPYDLAESEDVKEVLKIGPRIDMIPSTYDQAVYVDMQEHALRRNSSDGNNYSCPPDELMLDSGSNKRLFSNTTYSLKKLILNESDRRYQLVKRRMLDSIVVHADDSGGHFKDYEIRSIELILHENVWTKYRLACQKLEIDYGRGSKNEKLLFHGSSYIERIQNYGFDERYARRDGMFGAGIYFATNSSKSNQYTFGWGQGCQEHMDKFCYRCERKMIYSQVALGRSLTSKEALPECAHAPPGYSSVTGTPGITDNLAYPEYVIYSGDQAYPLFVITYRIKP